MRESYKRFVKAWICFANPWICTVSWLQILTSKRFVSYRGSRILTLKDSFKIVSHESSQFLKFAHFYKSNKSLRILSTIAQNESLKIEIRKSESLRILKFQIRKSGFANPNLKDSYCGFVLQKQKSQITRFVSIHKDSYTNPASLIFT